MPLYRFGLTQQDATDEVQWHQNDIAAMQAAAAITAELHRHCRDDTPERLVLVFRVNILELSSR